jgi:hypothetical protein
MTPTLARAVRSVAAVVAAVLVLSGLSVTPASAAGTLSVSGVVYLGSTATPAGAGEVLVRWGLDRNNIPATGILTDASGSFTIPGLTDGGWYYLFYDYQGTEAYPDVFHPGVVNGASGTQVKLAGADITGLSATVPAPGAITGTVTLLATGAPYSDVEVSAYRHTGSSSYVLTGTTVTPDSAGTYSIPNLPAGTYKIRFANVGSAPVQSGYYGGGGLLYSGLSTPTQYGGATDTAARDMAMTPIQSITGTVSLGTTANPAGASQVAVSAWYWDGEHGGNVVLPTVYTSASGAFTIPDIGIRTQYTLGFTFVGTGLDGYHPLGVSNLSMGTAAVTTQNVTLTKANTIAGTVQLGAGGPMAGAGDVTVTLSRYSYPDITLTTMANGAFVANTLNPGTYTVSFHYNGVGYPDLTLPAPITIPVNATGLEVVMPRGGIISGAVRRATVVSGVVSGVTVVAHRVDPVSHAELGQYTAVSDAKGRYYFAPVADGTYWVEFTKPGWIYQSWGGGQYGTPTYFEVNADYHQPIDASLYIAAKFKGTVTAPTIDDFTPGAFTVEVFVKQGVEWVSTGRVATVDQSRRYEIGNFVPGEYRLRVAYDGSLGHQEQTSPAFTIGEGSEQRFDATLVIPWAPLAVGTLVKPVGSSDLFLVDGASNLVRLGSTQIALDAGLGTSYSTVRGVQIMDRTVDDAALSNLVRCGSGIDNTYLATGGHLVRLADSLAATWSATTLTAETCAALPQAPGAPLVNVLYLSSMTGEVLRMDARGVGQPLYAVRNTGSLILNGFRVHPVESQFFWTHSAGQFSEVPGTLHKAAGSPTIYISDGDELLPISSLAVVADFGLSTKVTEHDPAYIANYDIGSEVFANLITCQGTYYLGSGGMKQPVAAPVVAPLAVVSLNADTCNAIPSFRPAPSYFVPPLVSTALFLKSPLSPTVYYVNSSGQKQAVVATSQLAILSAPDAPRTLTVSDTYLASIPSGPKLLPVGAMVRGPSQRVYFVAGFTTLVPILSYDTTASMGLPSTYTSVTQADIDQATVLPDATPLTNTLVCAGQTYFAASGTLWPVAASLVAGLPQTVLDASACSVLPKSASAVSGALVVQAATGGTRFQIFADGSKRQITGSVALRPSSALTLTVANSFLASLPTGPPIAPLQITRPSVAHLAPLATVEVSTESVARVTVDERAACYAAFVSALPISVVVPVTSIDQSKALLAECLTP